jgi:serine/threonine protein phosphatase PrpC
VPASLVDGVVIALADGAGGTGHGEVAAQAVIDAVTQGAPAGRAWSALLEELDRDGA